MKYEKNQGRVNNKILFLLAVVVLLFSINITGREKEDKQKTQINQTSFLDHEETNFPLTGRHRAVPCEECHVDQIFKGNPTQCETCHWDRQQDDRYKLQLGRNCGECHTPFSWKNVSPGKWNHGFNAGYLLNGKHKTVDCIQCHGDDGFESKGVDCFSCHQTDYRSARDPEHQAAGFPTDCRLCHINESSWQNAQFSHTHFFLKGRHRSINCVDCHQDGIYRGLTSDCFSCHSDDYNSAKNPDHLELNFPTLCEVCHNSNVSTWEGARYSHSKFPLKGKHFTAACSDCHKSGIYEGLPSDCVTCHLDDYLNAENPNHKQLGFHTDCQICHGKDAVSWRKSSFQHNVFWQLQGGHKRLDCIFCHKKGRSLPRDCADCHRRDYDSTTDPSHKTAGFPLACEQCHLPTHGLWIQAIFFHRFPLKNSRHAGLSCMECHSSGEYKIYTCINCHAHEKRRADRIHRKIPGYNFTSQACLACHYQGRR